MFLLFLLGLLPQISLGTDPAGVPAICGQMSSCGADCYTTCVNQCQCDVTADGAVPFPTFGGECQETGFCEGEFSHLEDCIEGEGPSCPTMLGTKEVVEQFSSFDFRIDVRSEEEWQEGHANVSIHTPGLAFNPAAGYMDKIGGLEEKRILVYCRSGGRAFDSSVHLLKWGFKNIHSFYHGGFPNVNAAIREDSLGKADHPTRGFCYITGSSDICPAPLPTSHITSVDDITSLKREGGRLILVDVRPSAGGRLANAVVVLTDKERRVKKFVRRSELDEEKDVVVVFCQGGVSSFRGAKKIKKHWDGMVYWVDNGGFPFLSGLAGIDKI